MAARLPLLALLVVPALAACLAPPAAEPTGPAVVASVPDAAMVAPEMAYYTDMVGMESLRVASLNPGYHTLDQIFAKIDSIAADHADLIRLEEIGASREGRPLKALVFQAAPAGSPVVMVDGGHHANEYEGIETTIFLADFLAANYGSNATVTGILDRIELRVVPLVNPDGYVRQSRVNAAGVNLNRNYDLDWCAKDAANNCEKLLGLLPQGEYAGEAPWSEPESRAIRDQVLAAGSRLSYYVSLHTQAHCITAPWTATAPPYPIPAAHRAVFNSVFSWVAGNTEFTAGNWTADGGECMDYNAGGTSQDWTYATLGVPTFTMETAGGSDGTEFAAPPGVRDLSRWAWATLDVHLFLLQNAARLKAWEPELLSPAVPAADLRA